jgi:hypothetical protein
VAEVAGEELAMMLVAKKLDAVLGTALLWNLHRGAPCQISLYDMLIVRPFEASVGRLRGHERGPRAQGGAAEHAGSPDGERVCHSISGERIFRVGEPLNLEMQLESLLETCFA